MNPATPTVEVVRSDPATLVLRAKLSRARARERAPVAAREV